MHIINNRVFLSYRLEAADCDCDSESKVVAAEDLAENCLLKCVLKLEAKLKAEIR
jgi:hypothetical protein